MMNNGLIQDFQSTFLVATSKDTPKDRKIQACLRLSVIANNCSSIEEYTTDWRGLFDALLDGIQNAPRTGQDIRRHLGETLTAMMTLMPYELPWFTMGVKNRFRMLNARAEEERAILVNALWQATQRGFMRGFVMMDNFVKPVVVFIVECLEKNNSHVVLAALLEAVIQLSSCCPHIFEHHFMEVVDFTIGWLVEPAPVSVVEKCQETLLALKPYWAYFRDYAYELMGHFREDIAAYIQDAIEKEDLSILRKSRSVMVTLATIIEIIIDIGEAEHTEILEVIRQTVASITVFSTQLDHIHSHYVAQFFASYCNVFSTVFKLCTYDYAQQLLLDCLDEAVRLTCLHKCNAPACIEFLDFFAKANAVNVMPLEVTEKLLDNILGEDGFLRQIDFRVSTKAVYASVSRLLASMLSPLSMQQLQKSFLLVKAIMMEDAATLTSAISNHNIPAHDVQHAEVRFIVFVKSLEKFAMLKNSLVVIMAVKPSLLNVLCTELSVTVPGFSERFPAVHLAIVKVIISHVESHEYFLANCEWLSGARGGMISESVTSKHVQLQLQTICKCLLDGMKWKHTRELVSNWLTALVSRIDDKSLALIVKREEWKPLRQALIAAHMKEDVDDGFYEVAKRLEVLTVENEAEAVEIMATVNQKVSTNSSGKGVKIRNGIDHKLLIRHSVSIKGWDQTETRQQRIPAANFTTANFNMLADFLLKSAPPSFALNPTEDDLWIFDTIDALYFMSEQNRTGEKGKPKFIQKWRYALGQMANYCIENRMKTSLGKPMETFNAFGAEVQRLAKEALGMIERKKTPETPKPQRKTNAKDEEEDDDFGRARPLTDAEEWWRVRCLLEFIEILDKLISNAHTGFVFPIANVSQLSRQFFCQNLASCQEWLNRTYSSAMVVAFHSGSYAQVIRFGSSALIDLERRQLRAEAVARERESSADEKSPSPEQPAPPPISYAILGWMARAMAELGAVQATTGLQEWMKKVYKVDVSWLEGSVDMAGARYEQSLVKFNAALRDETLPDTVKTLIRAMMFDVLNRLRLPRLLDMGTCPPDMCIWTEAEALGSKVPKGIDADAITKLKQLTSFAKVEQVTATNPVKWDVSRAVFYKEAQFMQTLRRHEMVAVKDEISSLGTMVMLGDSGLRTHGRIAVLEGVVSAIVSKMNKVLLSEIELSPAFLASDDKNADIGERLCHARRLSFWAERLAGGCAVHADAAIFARKTGNEMLALELLKKAVATEPMHKQPKLRLTYALQRAKMMWLKEDPNQRAIAWSEAFQQMSGALQAENQRQQYIFLLNQDGSNFQNGAMNNGGIQVPPPMPGFPMGLEPINEQISKTALHLAEWMQTDQSLQISPDVYANPLWTQLEATAVHTGGDIVGSLLSLATSVSPSLAKGHLRLADWSYTVATAGTKEKEMFDTNYRVLLGGEVQQSILDGLWKALNTCASLGDLEQAVNTILTNDMSSARSILAFGSHYTNLWSQLVQRRSVFLTNAVNSYFAYISQLGSRESSSGSVSATLRILGLLANHADILQSHLEEGMAQTNELLWKDILPQLFSRLSHPSKIVRELILSLLSKLCTSSPHSLVYQVVSGTASFSFVEDSDDVLNDEDEDEDSKKEKGLMFDCCTQLEALLQEMYPSLVRDVREFVAELHKISLLYEEKWTFVLSNLDHEMTKRLEQIKAETVRSQNFVHLDEKTKQDVIAEKAQLITSPVYRILDDLYERTCKKTGTSTANEEMFVRTFAAQLKTAFEQSEAHRKNPEKAWAPFREVLGILMQKGSRRGAQSFHMEDISTVLAKIHGTCIPLPGQENLDYSEVLTLEKVGGSTQVLPTKTRPKKMMFVGSDGKEHIFLFKGQEDLHLDERIMQLLNICNLMLGKSATKDWPAYSARSYAVTPLGQRSGLIQWVGGATPMFQIYRKWQQKQAQIKSAMEKKSGVSVAVTEAERPTDMYQKTLRAAFLKHKVAPEVIADRNKWPQPVLKEVLHSLMKETPKDLLSRELWVRSGSSDTWWRIVCRLARSSAVMSVIGAVLGLGDRHLDNLLVNLDNGQIVHIDYNICFDKGKNLRVPETVPFRLTQNLVHAMGPTQIEGVFRESCRHVMSNLREGREALLTVLEAFVYDPLVDWAAGDHLTSTSAAVSVAVSLAVYGSDSRVQEAKPIARKMFSVRTKELAVPWMGNCHELSRALDGVRTVLRKQLTIGASVWDKPEAIELERVEAGRRLKIAIGMHHQMMKDFRPLLRALATCDERFAGLTKRYKELFSEPLIKGHLMLESQPSDLSSCVKQFDIVLQNIAKIYTELITMDVTSATENGTATAVKERGPSPPPGLDSLRAGQQEQNAHAKSVVRRVRARLEGRVDETRNVLAVDEQVDSLIRQATSTTLLSLMYEGWTAWV